MTPLRTARLRAGMTQEALAETLGVGVIAVSRWEQGRQLPHPRTRARVEALLGAIEWPGETVFCACGRVQQECDGSRAACAASKAARVEQAWERLRAAWDAYMIEKGATPP